MEALKAIKIIGNQNDGRAVFYFFQIPGNNLGFKFHARPQTGAYSCLKLQTNTSNGSRTITPTAIPVGFWFLELIRAGALFVVAMKVTDPSV